MMNALPLFPQNAPPSSGVIGGGNLPSPTGEQGSMIRFDALMAQNAPVNHDADTLAPTTGQPASATSGSFEDVGVILQMLRASFPSSTANVDAAADASAVIDMTAPVPAQEPVQFAGTPTPIGTNAPDLPPELAQILGKAEAKPREQRLTLPEMVAALNDALPPVSAQTNVPPDLPVLAEPVPAMAKTSQITAPDAAALPPQTAVLLQAIVTGLQQVDPAAASQPQIAQAAAMPIPIDTPRKSGTASAAPYYPAIATEGSDTAPAATAMARMATIAAANPALPSPVLSSAAAPMIHDGAASMAVLFHQTMAQQPTAIDAAAPATTVQEQILDMNSDDAWIDQLAKDIAATKSGSGDISFRLMPRHLGRLDIAMTQNDNGLSLRMDAQNEVTASIVAAGQNRLVEELRQQGVRVASADVTHSPGDASRQSSGRDGQGQQAARNHFIETTPDRLPDAGRGDKGADDRRGRFA